MEPPKQEENKTKPIGKEATIQDIRVPAQAGEENIEVQRRIAHMEAMQKFQLIAKKKSRLFWKKMLGIK
jgi:hypothetical protein